jgi:thiol-disulfide isomerase/thioredoxin
VVLALLLIGCVKQDNVETTTPTRTTPVHGLIAHEGAVPGAWTMDLDAAKAAAAELNLPILLDFTGSDWCGACKQMDAYVLQQQRFLGFAKDRLMLVTIDLPRDWSGVPEKFRPRNEKLQALYQIAKFPTLLILDSDGSSVLGEARGIPELSTFKSEVRGLLKYSAKAIAKRAAELGEANAKRYQEQTAAYLKAQQAFNTWINTRPSRNDENMVILENFKNRIVKATAATEKLESEAFAAKLPGESATAYRELYSQRAGIMKELRAAAGDQSKLGEINGRLEGIVAQIEDMRTSHFASMLDEATATDYRAAHSELRKIRQERNNYLAQDASLSEESRVALERFDIAMEDLRARIEVHE